MRLLEASAIMAYFIHLDFQIGFAGFVGGDLRI